MHNSRPYGHQGNFVLELRAFWIGIEIDIVIEIDFCQCSDLDFDFDELCPTLGVPCEQHPT
jgi:predicted nucleic acid-binding Zn finger protein